MKDKTLDRVAWVLSCIASFGLGLLIGICGFPDKGISESLEQDTIFAEEVELTLDDHINIIVPDKLQNICRAIIWVESRGNASAVSSNGKYVGILQLGELYVQECNRVQDSVVYTYEDRYDSVKSLEMFVIYQNKHNPKHDIHRAIHIHNPTAGPDYKAKVLRKFETIY